MMFASGPALRRSFSVCTCLQRTVGKSSKRIKARRVEQEERPYRPSRDRSPPSNGDRWRPRRFEGKSNFATQHEPLPYFKFSEMLNRRIAWLQYSSQRLHELASSLADESKISKLVRQYCAAITMQSPSVYQGLPVRKSSHWAPQVEGVPTLLELKQAYELGGPSFVDNLVVQQFTLYASISQLSPAQLAAREKLADMSLPAEWYPLARSMQRKLHLHVGPTNSGKTYQALKRLEQSESGVFAGPLRLLAHEVYERFTVAGIPCNLKTGEEKRLLPEARITSCTIEMLTMGREIDVLVVDEIQMIGDRDRGHTWTAALLGCAAKEIHMCGEASVVPLVQKIAASIGEEVEVHEYTRLGGLQVADQSLGNSLAKVEAGDAVVTFSRKNIFTTKRAIEDLTGRKCAVIYGALPPETRAAQARLFNDPDSGYDVLVASDAIGMGLNLSIKRVVFTTVRKFDGTSETGIPIPQIKQIAGRAGRFKAKPKAVDGEDTVKDVPGFVTTMKKDDLTVVRDALATPTINLNKALLSPPPELVEAFFRMYGKDVKRSVVVQHLQHFAKTSELYEMVKIGNRVELLDMLEGIDGLRFSDAWTLSDAPVKTRDPQCVRVYIEMAKKLGQQEPADLLEFEEMPIELLDEGVPSTPEKLQQFESLHAQVILYLWLAMRYPGVFTSLLEALHLKIIIEDHIQQGLALIKSKRSIQTKPTVMTSDRLEPPHAQEKVVVA